jgi:hypothetical protein
MKKLISWGCILGSIAFISTDAWADGDFKFRAGESKNSYELDITPASGSGSRYSAATASYTGTNFGVTYIFSDSTYVDLAISNGNGSFSNSSLLGDGTISRSDLAAIYGMNLATSSGNMVNLYIGYKSGKTALVSSTGASELDFNASGLVLGGGWIIPFKEGEAGALGLSAGLGIMSGQYTYGPTPYTADLSFGFALGIGYTLPFTKNFGASIDYKVSDYNYTYNSGTANSNSIDEKFSSTIGSLWLKF